MPPLGHFSLIRFARTEGEATVPRAARAGRPGRA
jgi:hypothetical protein